MNWNQILKCVTVALAATFFVTPRLAEAQVKVEKVAPRGKKVTVRPKRIRQPKVKSYRSSASPKKTTRSNAAYYAEYVLAPGAQHGYSVMMICKTPTETIKWVGTMVLSTSKETPLLPSGQTNDSYGTVNSFGLLKSYSTNGVGKWVRNPEGDIYIPKTMNFSKTKVTGHEHTRGLERLPNNICKHMRIMEAIFPEVSYYAQEKTLDTHQSYLLQQGMAIKTVQGKGTLKTSANNNRSSRIAEFEIPDVNGNLYRKVLQNQQATFDPNTRMMQSSKTFFMITEDSPTVVTAETQRISYEAALKMIGK